MIKRIEMKHKELTYKTIKYQNHVHQGNPINQGSDSGRILGW